MKAPQNPGTETGIRKMPVVLFLKNVFEGKAERSAACLSSRLEERLGVKPPFSRKPCGRKQKGCLHAMTKDMTAGSRPG